MYILLSTLSKVIKSIVSHTCHLHKTDEHRHADTYIYLVYTVTTDF